MDVDSIEKALMKNPRKWAEMFLENQKLLDAAVVDSMTHAQSDAGKPQGMFDPIRLNSFVKLLTVMSGQMYNAFKSERDGASLMGKSVTDQELSNLQDCLETSLRLTKQYRTLKGAKPNEEVSPSLRDNNPCNVQVIDGKTGLPTMSFPTVEQGLANTMQVVKYVLDGLGATATYDEFFDAWFENYVNRDQLHEKAMKHLAQVRDPKSVVLRTMANQIVLTEIITTVEYTDPIDREYINKHYTLDKYVAAAAMNGPDVRAI